MTAPRQSDRAFGLMLAAVFAVVTVAGYLIYEELLFWALAVAGIFLVFAGIAPKLLMPLNRLWSWFAGGLGHINNFLLLGVFYYVVIFPVGLLIRMIGSDPMTRKIDRSATTYLTPVGRQANKDSFDDLF
jgi:hypothetical protein